MKIQMVGCNHHKAGLEIRQRLAFDANQTAEALRRWRSELPGVELALLSTCNRIELYAASSSEQQQVELDQLIDTLLEYHQISREVVDDQLDTLTGSDVIRHLFRVSASLDSMVVGEPQILAQVKKAYQSAQEIECTGPVLHELFQSALRTAKRVTSETSLHKHRVSIPSLAIADLASCIFESFDNKHVLVLGAGEMAEETLRYLHEAGNAKIHVINRNEDRGRKLAETWSGEFHSFEELWDQLALADLAISTTASTEPLVTAAEFNQNVAPRRHQRPFFILDLAVPRDFEPEISDALGVYLYSLDDLDQACEQNRQARAEELPVAEKIVLQETDRFLADLNHRSTAPVISDLRQGLERPKASELERLFRKLPDLDDSAKKEIEQFADRLVNKMLHPPLESLRDASKNGTHHGLLDALKRLFSLEE